MDELAWSISKESWSSRRLHENQKYIAYLFPDEPKSQYTLAKWFKTGAFAKC